MSFNIRKQLLLSKIITIILTLILICDLAFSFGFINGLSLLKSLFVFILACSHTHFTPKIR